MPMGPVQLLVVGFAGGEFKGEILAELDRLRENDIVRLIDLVFVRKDEDGRVEKILRSDLSPEEAEEFGATVGALIGFGAAGEEGAELGAIEGAAALEDGHVFDDEVWYVEDAIPNGTAAAVALLEHRWAVPLRDGIRRAGGFHLADAWIHPADLVGIGLIAAEEAELQLAKS
ncbi:MAG TPA: DUF6325 family protein [Gaiellaceae bacterium]|nr:DUF6325 family protein [Gaiellaceae bacterium]